MGCLNGTRMIAPACLLHLEDALSPQPAVAYGAGLLLSFDMKQDITSKLNIELDQEIVSERQVVYILVEARKLLEQQKTLDEFRAFKLCSDWAVHPKLTRRDSQTILKHFDAYEAEHQKSGITVAEFQLEPLHDFMTYKRFRAEFIEALSPHGVEVGRLSSNAFWQPFIQHYSAVIQDCPLEAIGNNTQFVSHVSGLAWPKEKADAIYPGKRVIQWNWMLKNSTKRKLVCALV
jgi:hypothetical protein